MNFMAFITTSPRLTPLSSFGSHSVSSFTCSCHHHHSSSFTSSRNSSHNNAVFRRPRRSRSRDRMPTCSSSQHQDGKDDIDETAEDQTNSISNPPSSPTSQSESESESHSPDYQMTNNNNNEQREKTLTNATNTSSSSSSSSTDHETTEQQQQQSEANSPSSLSSKPKDIVSVKLGSLPAIDIPARSLLYVVPFLWGSFGPAVRFLFSQHPHQLPSVFNSERLLLSTLIYFPILFREFQALSSLKRNNAASTSSTIKCVEEGQAYSKTDRFAFFPKGVELGVYVFIANIAQVIGLQQTSASRASFLVQLQTVFVPILGALLGTDRIKPATAISSFVAVGGVLLLSLDKNAGTQSSLTGDALEVLSAVFFSLYIIRLSRVANRVAPNPLVATKIAVQALLSIVWATLTELQQSNPLAAHVVINYEPWTLSTIAIGAGVVLWTGLMTSALSGWAQTKGQQAVPASEAALIFATQPLWATAIAAIALGETFGPRGIAGGGLIVVATLVPILAEQFQKEKRNTNSADDNDNKESKQR